MLLAEALAERADALDLLKKRQFWLRQLVKINEGDEVVEDPYKLIREQYQTLDRLLALDKQIHKTNTKTMLHDNQSLLSAVIRLRIMMKKRRLYSITAERASDSERRYSRNQVKYFTIFNIAELHNKAEQVDRDYQKLAAMIQKRSWETKLL